MPYLLQIYRAILKLRVYMIGGQRSSPACSESTGKPRYDILKAYRPIGTAEHHGEAPIIHH